MQHGKLLDRAEYVLNGQGAGAGRRGRIRAHPLIGIHQVLPDAVPIAESLPVVAYAPPRIGVHLPDDPLHGGTVQVEKGLDPIPVDEAARAVPGLIPPPRTEVRAT